MNERLTSTALEGMNWRTQSRTNCCSARRLQLWRFVEPPGPASNSNRGLSRVSRLQSMGETQTVPRLPAASSFSSTAVPSASLMLPRPSASDRLNASCRAAMPPSDHAPHCTDSTASPAADHFRASASSVAFAAA